MDNFAWTQKGFTLIEIVVAIVIIAVMALILYPNIMGSLEKRKLESVASDVQTTLQRAKFQAVKTRLNHRVRFVIMDARWVFLIEREDSPDVWNTMSGFIRKTIPSQFNVSINFPNQIVEFSPLGFVSNYNVAQNSITLQNLKLQNDSQVSQIVVMVFIGGSVQNIKSQSE